MKNNNLRLLSGCLVEVVLQRLNSKVQIICTELEPEGFVVYFEGSVPREAVEEGVRQLLSDDLPIRELEMLPDVAEGWFRDHGQRARRLPNDELLELVEIDGIKALASSTGQGLTTGDLKGLTLLESGEGYISGTFFQGKQELKTFLKGWKKHVSYLMASESELSFWRGNLHAILYQWWLERMAEGGYGIVETPIPGQVACWLMGGWFAGEKSPLQFIDASLKMLPFRGYWSCSKDDPMRKHFPEVQEDNNLVEPLDEGAVWVIVDHLGRHFPGPKVRIGPDGRFEAQLIDFASFEQVLIEQGIDQLPFWLAPEHVRVISEREASEAALELRKKGFRVLIQREEPTYYRPKWTVKVDGQDSGLIEVYDKKWKQLSLSRFSSMIEEKN